MVKENISYTNYYERQVKIYWIKLLKWFLTTGLLKVSDYPPFSKIMFLKLRKHFTTMLTRFWFYPSASIYGHYQNLSEVPVPVLIAK